MKYLRQFMIIVCICFAGEILHRLLPFPVPASIYGLVLMLGLLLSGKLALESVKETAVFLVEIMPVMFVPPAVGLMDSFGVLLPILVPFLVITFATTVIVMVVSGHFTQFIIRSGKKKKTKRKEVK